MIKMQQCSEKLIHAKASVATLQCHSWLQASGSSSPPSSPRFVKHLHFDSSVDPVKHHVCLVLCLYAISFSAHLQKYPLWIALASPRHSSHKRSTLG